MASVYRESLDRDSRTIRIVTLLPGPWHCRIECQLQQVFLDDDPVYEAVSYAWGRPDDTVSLLVEGIEMQVPGNLESCLRHLRKTNEAVQLWVDSICINQRNLREKQCQVGMMGEIYRRCTSVYLWLGVPILTESVGTSRRTTDHQINPFNIIDHFAGDHHLHELSWFQRDRHENYFLFHDDDSFKKIWESFKDVLQKPWWSRLWCVQECLLPSSAMVVLGHWRVSWERLKLSQANYRRHVRSCCAEVSGLMPLDYIVYPDMTVFQTQLDSSATSSTPSDISSDLDKLLRTFLYKACTDPRDKVYGVLGLLDRSKYPQLVIDYTMNTEAVFTHAMSAMLLDGGGDLRCLTGLGFASTEGSLPSWVRDFGAKPTLESVSQDLKRLQSYSLYNASSSTNCRPIILNHRRLCLHGIFIDKIFRVGKSIERRSWKHTHEILQNWSILAGVDIPADITSEYFYGTKANAFWRTVVGDRLFENDELLRRTSRADLEGFRLWLPKMLVAIKTGVEPPLEAWLRTVTSFTYGRSMFLTEKGHLGLCYPACQPGDELWAFHGGRVPFILRPKNQQHGEGGQDGPSDQYRFMGDGYLHGFMDGEIMKDYSSRTQDVVLW